MRSKNITIAVTAISMMMIFSCKKFVEVELPKTQLTSQAVFESDATATAAILDIYNQLVVGFASGSSSSITVLTGWSSDELNIYSPQIFNNEFYLNNLTPENTTNAASIWTKIYQIIYKANAAIEGLNNSNGTSIMVKNQLLGEAFYMRAFAHFYLVNLYGDVPLIITTDYRQNASAIRNPKADVIQQIKDDLLNAMNLLGTEYLGAANAKTSEKARLTKYAANALLARVYLYNGEWVKSEEQSSIIIGNTITYNLAGINEAFLKNNTEAIWQLPRASLNTDDANAFIFESMPTSNSLSNTLVESFELGDSRRTNWVGTRTISGIPYYFAYKYKSKLTTPVTEYTTVFRLAEQFLIRAEARLMQGKIIGQNSAETDLNRIRNRANLTDTKAVTASEMLLAIEQERRHELFTEWGHRWFDLKRWKSLVSPANPAISRADDIFSTIKPGWNKEDKLYPIPKVQLDNDPAMAGQQNPGYQ